MLIIERKGLPPLEIPRDTRKAGDKAIDAYVADGGKAYAAKKAAEAKALAEKEAKAAKQEGGSK